MTIYHVAKTGSNGNSGLSGFPKLTIRGTNGGCSVLSPGDTLQVDDDGIYAEQVISSDLPNGTSGNHTIIKGAAGLLPKIVGNGGSNAFFFNGTKAFITIDGFDLDASAQTSTLAVIQLGDSGLACHDITIKNSIIRHNHTDDFDGTYHYGGSGIFTPGPGGASYNIIIQRCSIFDMNNGLGNNLSGTGIYLRSRNSIIEDCNIYGNGASAIQLYSQDQINCDDNIIRRNRLHDNGFNGATISSGLRNFAYNNIIYRNSSSGMRFFSGANGQMLSNTVVSNGIGIWIFGGNGGFVVRNNILFQNVTNYKDDIGGTVQDHNLMGINPLFVDQANDDYRLQSGSPAIDAAMDLSSIFTDDFYGGVRG